ncbi:MAG: M48 family metalloprotease [Acidimicrobiia bacterium]|nr:M48 family metalloprotease [Acidimicrobiia bacterium]
MGHLVYLPFALTVAAVVVSRLATSRLPARAAAWSTAVTMVALAATTTLALAILASPLIARVPLVAHLGRWRPAAVALHSPIPACSSAVAVVALLLVCSRVGVEVQRLARQFRDAARTHDHLHAAPAPLVVIEDHTPVAYAVSRATSRSGRIVMSTGMIDLLDRDERHAVVAHETAHLHHRHDLFLAAADLAVAVNPLLRPARADLRYSLERWADEDAATSTSRPVVAAALAKAAVTAIGLVTTPGALHLHSHDMTRRVAALLADGPPAHRRLAWGLVGLAVVAAGAIALATHDTERFFEAVRRS